MKLPSKPKWQFTIITTTLLSLTLAVVTLVHGQRNEPRVHWTTAAELPLAPGTNDLARVRIVSGGKILRVSELVHKARESMDMQGDLGKDVQRDMLVTVYVDGYQTNLCWIGFSAGIGKRGYSVHFNRAGNIVSARSFIAIDQVGDDQE